MKKVLLFICFFGLVGYSWCQNLDRVPLKDIRDVFTQQQFRSAGLHKLSETELQELSGNLYGWKAVKVEKPAVSSPTHVGRTEPESKGSEKVKGDRADPVPTVRQEQAFGREAIEEKEKASVEKQAPKSIVSTIEGPFEGWNGNTVFRLKNGQVWRQIDKSVFYERTQDPKVEIKKGLLGVYYLSIEGYGSRCKVKRVH